MAYSSILGAEQAPVQPSGRDARALGPSDNSDTGSDAQGTTELHADSDAAGTGERGSVAPDEGREGGDILPDRVVRAPGGSGAEDEDGGEQARASGFPETDPDAQEFTDLDPGDDEQPQR